MDDLVRKLRNERIDMQIPVQRLAKVSGVTREHIHRIEKDENAFGCRLDTARKLAAALGFEIVLRPMRSSNIRQLYGFPKPR